VRSEALVVIRADSRRQLAALIRHSQTDFPLAEAALWIAADDLPNVEPAAYLARLDGMAARAREISPEAAEGGPERIAAVLHVLFREEQFVGNLAEYEDPRNSYLSEVLDRRTGLPITLSIVFIEVARRAGLTAYGLNFPGHFLAMACYAPDGLIVLDPFNHGAMLDADELQARWQKATHAEPPPLATLLAPAGSSAIILRMLNNLRIVCLRRGDPARAIATLEKMVLVDPLGAAHHRDLGALYLTARLFGRAAASLEQYLRLAPEAEDADAAREQLRAATEMVARWN
jgi:regulator of sirC expression with transglutaminase-like and TPR domain